MIQSIFWYICKAPNNMGDWIGPYLFEKMTGIKPIKANPSGGSLFILSCGSVINACNSNAIVWGTGTLSRTGKVSKPHKVLAVRGPITRKLLLNNGIQCPPVYGDPGLLLPRYYTPKTAAKRYKIGLIPHYADHHNVVARFKNHDILIIDVNRTVEAVCDDIVACDTILSSSLHGIIIAHAYNIPAAWMTTSPKPKWPIGGGRTKYDDYYLSIGVSGIKPLIWSTLGSTSDQLKEQVLAYPPPLKFPDLNKLEACCPFGKTAEQVKKIKH